MKTLSKIAMISLSTAAVLTIGTTAAASSIKDAPTETSTVKEASAVEYVFATGEVYENGQTIALGIDDISTDDMTLISESESVEDGLRIVDKVYVKDISNASASRRVQEITRQRTVYDTGESAGEPYVTMYVSGIFTSDGSTAYVSSPGHWYAETEKGKGSYIRDKKYTYESDTGGFFGNKYAFIEYIATIRIGNGQQRDFRLWVDVDSTGAVHIGV